LRPGEDDTAQQLFAGLRVAPLTEREGWQAGSWRREHASRGRTLSQADCLVAAAAVAAGARLATGNPKDFPMRGLIVEHWPAGESQSAANHVATRATVGV
jgi:predicted nucleic acid-binding protein